MAYQTRSLATVGVGKRFYALENENEDLYCLDARLQLGLPHAIFQALRYRTKDIRHKYA